MPDVVKEAKRHHNDLANLKETKNYKTRMEKRAKRKQITVEELEWWQDDAEYASRIWEWWKVRGQRFPYYGVAIRLVVLSQLSSCSVERVFSRLKLIVDKCGTNMKSDMTEFRLMMQCNGNLEELLNEIQKD